jgi:hypothetical protein
MNSVQVNVDSYNEETHAIVVSFSGIDGNVEYSTPKYSFSAANYEATSAEDFIKKLAQTGLAYLRQEVNKQKSAADTNLKEQFKSLNNTTHTFEASELVVPTNLPINTNVVDNLEIQI